ncbi:MAG: DNA polymerase III subunit epsilon [Candidatus Dasytiphilus stammeri]
MNIKITRQIVLDIETTGMDKDKPGYLYEGHRIIEIGALEIVKRSLTGNNFHVYLNPNRSIDQEAFVIHGLTEEFLLNKPTFNQIFKDFIDYIYGTELIIHNASFDISFINHELNLLHRNIPQIESFCKITDTLLLARKMFPGKRNSLDRLCTRYKIDNSKRTLHGALLDAEILAEVYLAMTGGQFSLDLSIEEKCAVKNVNVTKQNRYLKVIKANQEELRAHQLYLDLLKNKNGYCLWSNEKLD